MRGIISKLALYNTRMIYKRKCIFVHSHWSNFAGKYYFSDPTRLGTAQKVKAAR